MTLAVLFMRLKKFETSFLSRLAKIDWIGSEFPTHIAGNSDTMSLVSDVHKHGLDTQTLRVVTNMDTNSGDIHNRLRTCISPAELGWRHVPMVFVEDTCAPDHWDLDHHFTCLLRKVPPGSCLPLPHIQVTNGRIMPPRLFHPWHVSLVISLSPSRVVLENFKA